jgi:hypothetical protein
MASDKTTPHEYRIEHGDPAQGSLLADPDLQHLYANASLAVAVAVKSVVDPSQQEVRVVHVPSGEVVFNSAADGKAEG